jgi:hypothetical protein
MLGRRMTAAEPARGRGYHRATATAAVTPCGAARICSATAARLAMNRSRSGLVAWSALATTAYDASDFHAAAEALSSNAETAIGRCETAATAAASAGAVCPSQAGNVYGSVTSPSREGPPLTSRRRARGGG